MENFNDISNDFDFVTEEEFLTEFVDNPQRLINRHFSDKCCLHFNVENTYVGIGNFNDIFGNADFPEPVENPQRLINRYFRDKCCLHLDVDTIYKEIVGLECLEEFWNEDIAEYYGVDNFTDLGW